MGVELERVDGDARVRVRTTSDPDLVGSMAELTDAVTLDRIDDGRRIRFRVAI